LLRARLSVVLGRDNPVGPDPTVGAAVQGITAVARVRGEHALIEQGHGLLRQVDSSRAWARRNILDAAHRARAGPTWQLGASEPAPIGVVAGIVLALALGDTGALEPSLRDRWADAGIAHLLAISGMHVGVLMGVLLFGLRWILAPLGEYVSATRVAASATALAAVLLCLAVGAPLSAVRATVMCVGGLLGLVLRRPAAGPNLLGLAAAGLLLEEPRALESLSFQLSFATTAVLVCGPRRGALGVSLWASAVSCPVLAAQGMAFSMSGMLLNLAAIPWTTLVVMPLSLATALNIPGGYWVADVAVRLLDWATRISLSGRLPVPTPVAATCACAIVLSIGSRTSTLPAAALSKALWEFVARLGSRRGARTAHVRMPVSRVGERAGIGRRGGNGWCGRSAVQHGLAAAVTIVLWRPCRQTGEFRILHPYVGQGDAAILLLPEGGCVLFDVGGPSWGGDDTGRRVIVPLLRQEGVGHVDVAIVSHPHPDHMRGLAAVATEIGIGELWITGQGASTPFMRVALRAVVEGGGLVKTLDAVPRTQTRQGVTFRILHPTHARPSFDPNLSVNDNSIVLWVSYAGSSFLFPGDIEAEAERQIQALPADGIKMPHHGSRTSSTASFVATVGPTVAVVSAGRDNVWGLPHAETLALYQAAGARVLRTDVLGLIAMTARQGGWAVTSTRPIRVGPTPATATVPRWPYARPSAPAASHTATADHR
jgi:competence protein ComEC